MKKTLFTLTSIFMLCSLLNAQTKLNFDKSHSSITFSIEHMVVSEVTGKFTDFNANLQTDKADFSDAKFDATIEVKSINTDNAKREEHLLGADFFDEAKFKTITFKGVTIQKLEGNKYKAIGDLTIKGVTKKVELTGKGGTVKDPWGKIRTGFKLSGMINRKDFGLKYNAALEAGGLTLGEEVAISVSVEFTK